MTNAFSEQASLSFKIALVRGGFLQGRSHGDLVTSRRRCEHLSVPTPAHYVEQPVEKCGGGHVCNQAVEVCGHFPALCSAKRRLRSSVWPR